MHRNIKKIILLSAASLLPLMYISGCGRIEMTDEEEELFVECAADAIISHDKNYIIKLAERETEEETEETTVWISDNPDKGTDGQPSGEGGENATKPQGNTMSANEAFALSGFSVASNGYEVVKQYPGSGNTGFSMVATQNKQLLVLKFNVTNSGGSTAVLNMTDKGYGYRCVINGKTKVNAQLTALLNGLNTWNGELTAGETREMVLVFQVDKEISADINDIKLYIADDNGIRETAIK